MSRSVLGYRLTTAVPAPEWKPRKKSKKITNGRPRLYPFLEMEVGESFFVPEAAISNITSAAAHHRANGRQFTARSETYRGTNGVRCWRVK